MLLLVGFCASSSKCKRSSCLPKRGKGRIVRLQLGFTTTWPANKNIFRRSLVTSKKGEQYSSNRSVYIWYDHTIWTSKSNDNNRLKINPAFEWGAKHLCNFCQFLLNCTTAPYTRQNEELKIMWVEITRAPKNFKLPSGLLISKQRKWHSYDYDGDTKVRTVSPRINV